MQPNCQCVSLSSRRVTLTVTVTLTVMSQWSVYCICNLLFCMHDCATAKCDCNCSVSVMWEWDWSVSVSLPDSDSDWHCLGGCGCHSVSLSDSLSHPPTVTMSMGACDVCWVIDWMTVSVTVSLTVRLSPVSVTLTVTVTVSVTVTVRRVRVDEWHHCTRHSHWPNDSWAIGMRSSCTPSIQMFGSRVS